LEYVALAELDLVGDTFFLGDLLALADQVQPLRVQVDAHATLGAELLDGRDDQAAVAATQVVNDILLADLGHLAHGIDEFLRRRHIADDDVVLFLVGRLAEIDYDFAILALDLARSGDPGVVA